MSVSTFDPGKVIIMLGGAPVTGFAPGTFVTVTQDAENFTKRAGADGQVVRTRRTNRMATMSLTLMAAAAFNAIMSGLEISEAIFPLLIKDGLTLIPAGEAWIEKPPDFERGDEDSDQEWIIAIAKWNPVFAGNP